MVDVTDLYVLVGNGANSQIVKYTFVRAGTTITGTKVSNNFYLFQVALLLL